MPMTEMSKVDEETTFNAGTAIIPDFSEYCIGGLDQFLPKSYTNDDLKKLASQFKDKHSNVSPTRKHSDGPLKIW